MAKKSPKVVKADFDFEEKIPGKTFNFFLKDLEKNRIKIGLAKSHSKKDPEGLVMDLRHIFTERTLAYDPNIVANIKKALKEMLKEVDQISPDPLLKQFLMSIFDRNQALIIKITKETPLETEEREDIEKDFEREELIPTEEKKERNIEELVIILDKLEEVVKELKDWVDKSFSDLSAN